MSEGYPRIKVSRKLGTEPFHLNGNELGFDLQSFWRWSVSDLISNVTRGRLAEYLVARALNLAAEGVRDEWAPYDLLTPSGIKIEVKSASLLQSWFQKKPSTISFVVRRTRAWDPETNQQAAEPRRQADLYVFAVLAHEEKVSLDPMNLEQWVFYVVPTSALDARERSQHSITLRSLRALAVGPARFESLAEAVVEVAGKPLE